MPESAPFRRVSPVVEEKRTNGEKRGEQRREKRKKKRERKNGIKKGVLFGGRQCNTLYASYNFVVGIYT